MGVKYRVVDYFSPIYGTARMRVRVSRISKKPADKL